MGRAELVALEVVIQELAHHYIDAHTSTSSVVRFSMTTAGVGWKFLFLAADKITPEAVARGMSWGARVTPAPVRDPSEDVYL